MDGRVVLSVAIQRLAQISEPTIKSLRHPQLPISAHPQAFNSAANLAKIAFPKTTEQALDTEFA